MSTKEYSTQETTEQTGSSTRNVNNLPTTDFCIANYKKYSEPPRPEVKLPRFYMFNQIVDPEEFMLGENLNTRQKHFDYRHEKLHKSKSKRATKSSKFGMPLDGMNPIYGDSTIGTILSKEEFDNAEFSESILSQYYGSSTTMYDRAIRPLFDSSGFFPYDLNCHPTNRVVIKTSQIIFQARVLDFPTSSIAKMSLYLTLTREEQCVGNIIEIELKQLDEETWIPNIFREFEWILDSSLELWMFAQVVALVRIQSNRQPFALKSALIGQGSAKLVEYKRGSFQPPVDGDSLSILLRKEKSLFREDEKNDEQKYLTFLVTHQTAKYPGLPVNFICPSSSARIFETLRLAMIKILDPIKGDFSKWNPMLVDMTLFYPITLSEMAFSCLIQSWRGKTEESLREHIRLIYPATKVTGKAGPYCLLSDADTSEKATDRMARYIIKGSVPGDEVIAPFQTDELRKNHVLYIPAKFK